MVWDCAWGCAWVSDCDWEWDCASVGARAGVCAWVNVWVLAPTITQGTGEVATESPLISNGQGEMSIDSAFNLVGLKLVVNGGVGVNGTRVAVIDVVRMFNMRNNSGETSGGGKARSGTVTGGVAVGLIIAVDTLVAAKSGFKCESNISGVSSGKYV